MASRVRTPWGLAITLEELLIPQRIMDERVLQVVQLLRPVNLDETVVRFATRDDPEANPRPGIYRTRDLERLVKALPQHPDIARMLLPLRDVPEITEAEL